MTVPGAGRQGRWLCAEGQVGRFVERYSTKLLREPVESQVALLAAEH